MQRQLELTTHEARKQQLTQAIAEIDEADQSSCRRDRRSAITMSTKHHFNRFARSLGYLDWATQPNPFPAL